MDAVAAACSLRERHESVPDLSNREIARNWRQLAAVRPERQVTVRSGSVLGGRSASKCRMPACAAKVEASAQTPPQTAAADAVGD